MAGQVLLLVGTRKGAFILESDAGAPILAASAARSARPGR